MSIPRKGSKSIQVDNKSYIYLVKQINLPDHKDQKASRLVIQEDVQNPGRVLRASFFYGVQITPTLVKDLIQEGIKLGWNPSDRGGAFDLPEDQNAGRWC